MLSDEPDLSPQTEPAQDGGSLAVRDEAETPMSSEMMDGQDWSWLLLVALFLVSVLVVLTWLVQYSLAILRPRRSGFRTQGRSDAHWQLPLNLTHQTLTGGVWGSLLRLRFGRGAGARETEAGVKGLLTSLFSFKSFREHWQRAWVRALNEQASRQGSSIQITFSENLQLPSSASIDRVTCTDQSAHSMVLQCVCSVDTVMFPVTVTQQSPAAVSMDTYQITIEPADAQLVVSLEEVEEEGLLVSWTFSQPPHLSVNVSSMRIQREDSDPEVDLDMIRDLVEDTLYSTQPAMILNLRACVSSPAFPRDKLMPGPNSLSLGPPATPRLLVRQLKATGVRKVESSCLGELCCSLCLDAPVLEKRTRFLTPSSSSGATLDWSEDIILDLRPDTKELQIRLLDRNSKGEYFSLGQTSLLLDVSSRSPSGQHVLSISPGHGLSSPASVTVELQYLEAAGSNATPLRLSHTPTKKVDVDRTIMPDGTIVTTVTTIQTRPKLDRKLGDSPSRSPSKVEVTEKRPTVLMDVPGASVSSTPSTESSLSNGLDPVAETAIRQLTESSTKVAKKTPTKRSTLIISGVSKVPISEDDCALSVGYAAAMDAALQGEHSPGGGHNHSGATTPHPDADETTPSDVSERPSVDDVESETGSTGALETRSLKDHKVGFLRSGTKLLFRRRNRQKDPSFSQSHEDVSNLGNDSASSSSASVRKKSGSFSRRLIKRFSFRSSNKSKGKSSATNGGASVADN
ncbi:phospholipid transfer protein C2CD2L isoform X2 [Sardina pilchardus]|uniref:phospholipid transfer protein C2CD2L isoform X2 n=1 Tax=Sardina pilchardus TaxID=27697 RepID=UPI002E103D22